MGMGMATQLRLISIYACRGTQRVQTVHGSEGHTNFQAQKLDKVIGCLVLLLVYRPWEGLGFKSVTDLQNGNRYYTFLPLGLCKTKTPLSFEQCI